jgi:hypothetical protein
LIGAAASSLELLKCEISNKRVGEPPPAIADDLLAGQVGDSGASQMQLAWPSPCFCFPSNFLGTSSTQFRLIPPGERVGDGAVHRSWRIAPDRNSQKLMLGFEEGSRMVGRSLRLRRTGREVRRPSTPAPLAGDSEGRIGALGYLQKIGSKSGGILKINFHKPPSLDRDY